MNKMPMLRTIISRSVVAVMALEMAACCGEDAGNDSRSVELRDTTKWNQLVDNCRADEEQCESLCQLVLQELEGAASVDSVWFYQCELDDAAALPILHMEYGDAVACGRRPMIGTEEASGDGSYFVRAALLEAASIQAFHEMAGHLSGFGAPASLVERCRKAAQEELEHALIVSELARRVSGDATLLPSLRSAERIWRDARMGAHVHAPSLVEFATHNAVEGCVRESLGAAVACWQSLHSCDARVREAFASIADEEASHAQLSWDIDSWCRTMLSPGQRRNLEEAKTRAASALWSSLAVNDNEAGGIAGLPDTEASRKLLDRIAGSSWGSVESRSLA